MTKNTNSKQRCDVQYTNYLFRSLNIEIWYLRFGIFNTFVSFSIKLAVFQASDWADT
jgi:hypothetical protein